MLLFTNNNSQSFENVELVKILYASKLPKFSFWIFC